MRQRIIYILMSAILTLLFFHQMALTDKILGRGDTYNYFYPYWDVRNDAYRAGELPLWTPDIFMGAPLLANPQLGTYYPPNWVTSPFRAPTAIKISILMHIALAILGMMALYRTAISDKILPAIVAGMLFAFGGYVGSHVEQINQLQGLAWMPILFALYHRLITGDNLLRDGLLLAMAWALQIFSGHTQTVFMTGIGLGLYGLVLSIGQWRVNHQPLQLARALILLIGVTSVALLLAIPQLLPTLELTGMSNRGGGFNIQQATAFSLSPNTMGRALLPSYVSQLFGEYVTYLGVIGLGVAFWGMVTQIQQSYPDQPSRNLAIQAKWMWIAIAVVGLLLAFGRFNPLYLILAELPGFNLFRVPARWLSLFALGMAMVGGLGIQSLVEGKRPSVRFLISVGSVLGGLIFLTRFVLQVDPRDVYGDAIPQNSSVMLWVISLLILLALLRIRYRFVPYILAGFILLELFLASLILPYNDLTPPEVYLGQRFTISQLLGNQRDEDLPGRVLSISQLFFDPGDIQSLRQRYDQLGLDDQSQFHALDAVKKQEMLMPNLPMTWGIPSIDGFGGGILPTIYYSQFTSLLLPDDELRTVDGRIGEILAKPSCRGACIPDLNWLRLTDTQYIITDKVFDIWHDDVAYDTTLADLWQSIMSIEKPDDNFDEVRILHTEPLATASTTTEEIQNGLLVSKMDWETLQDILQSDHSILAVTLAHGHADDVFLQVQPPPFQRVLSSDIKVYRASNDVSRAYIATSTTILPDDWQGHEDALDVLQNEGKDVIHNGVQLHNADNRENIPRRFDAIQFIDYSNTRVEIVVNANDDAYLILNDAYYPGWKATINDQPVPIYRANVMFRAVQIPADESRVVFYFEPDMWRMALIGGGILWAVGGLMVLLLWRPTYLSHT